MEKNTSVRQRYYLLTRKVEYRVWKAPASHAGEGLWRTKACEAPRNAEPSREQSLETVRKKADVTPLRTPAAPTRNTISPREPRKRRSRGREKIWERCLFSTVRSALEAKALTVLTSASALNSESASRGPVSRSCRAAATMPTPACCTSFDRAPSSTLSIRSSVCTSYAILRTTEPPGVYARFPTTWGPLAVICFVMGLISGRGRYGGRGPTGT